LRAADQLAGEFARRLAVLEGHLAAHDRGAIAARRARGSDSPVLFEECASGHVAVARQTMQIDALVWTFPRRS